MSRGSSEVGLSSSEEEEDSEAKQPAFGHEVNRSYAGDPMDHLDQLLPSDEEGGQLIFRIHSVVDHRYQIRSLIGRGTFSLVWVAYDHVMLENVAIKCLKRSHDSMFEDEYMINRYLTDRMGPNAKVIRFRRCFCYLDHCCMVFELVSQNILSLLNFFDTPLVPIPLNLIKKIVKGTLEGLDFMHKQGVIHTDLKPENVLASRPLFPYEPFRGDEQARVFDPLEDDPNEIDFKLGDIGNSCFIGLPSNNLIQTRQYRSPEVLLGLPYDASADIWSLACMTVEFATRKHLFDPEIGDDESETSTNKSSIDAIHLSMIELVIGPIPNDWARQGLEYEALYADGELMKRHEDQLPSVYEKLQKHGLSAREAAELADFLGPMLSVIPAQRPSAEELLQSPWLRQSC
jgi:serine/threonine protein kinase